MRTVKEVVARLECDSGDMIASVNDEAMKLFTAAFALYALMSILVSILDNLVYGSLSLLSEAGTGPDMNDPLLIKPSILKHARMLLRNIDRMMGDWCKSLEDLGAEAMTSIQSSVHSGVSVFARQFEVFKAERLLCEAKVKAAK